MKTLDSVFDWFMELNLPYWVLYRGHQTEKKNRTFAITENTIQMSTEASWERLERNIQIQSEDGGKFTILVTDKPKSNYGFTTFVELQRVEILPVKAPSQGVQNTTVSGIPLNAIGGIQGYVDSQIAAARTEMQLQFQNKLLEERIEQLENAEPEKLGERVIEYLMANGDKYLDKIVQLCAVFKGGGPAVNMAVNGPPISKKENQQPMQGPQTQEEYIQRLKTAQERVTAHIDILVVLETLADLIEQKPVKFVALLQDKERMTNLTNLL